MYQVIPSKVWKHVSGKTASIYGAVPYHTEEQKAQWEIVTVGYTVKNPHTGQIGIGRPAWKTIEEAQAFADTHTPSRICIGD